MAIAETERLTKMLAGAALSRAIGTVAELGVADYIVSGTPQNVEMLAQKTKSHESSLYRLLRFLASHEIFRETGNREFDHTALSSALRTDADSSFRPAARMFHFLFPGWDGLHHAVQTGGLSFEKVFGQPLFDYVGSHMELAPLFDAGMTSFHGHETNAMLDAYDFSDVQVFADIGGGNGSLISAVLQRYPKLKGIHFDLDHVSGRARAALQSCGVADRCSFHAGSFFESVPSGADTYLMRHIIHDWTDEQSVQILSNIRKVLPANGRVLLVEFAVGAANQSSLGKDADMIMLAFPGGMERTSEEYGELFQKSGLRLAKVVPTKCAVSVFEGRPV